MADERPYLYFAQKNKADLTALWLMLLWVGIDCGRIHNPSRRADPDYWRFFVRRSSIPAFIRRVGSWHPRKARLLDIMQMRLARKRNRLEQRRIVRQGDRNGDPLLLAAAQLVRPMARTVGEADEIKEFLGPSLPGRAVFGGEAHRQLDVLLGGQRRDEVEELEDEAGLSQSIPNEFSFAEVDEVGSVHLDSTRGRAVDPAQDIQEGRLAAPRRPSDRDEFAVIDVHVEAAQCDYFRFPRSIDFD